MSYFLDRIVYATELEPDDARVFRHAVGLARQFDAKLHVITVAKGRDQPRIDDYLSHEEIARLHADAADALHVRLESRIDAFCTANPDLDARGVIAELHVRDGDAAAQILALAGRVGAGMIVLGSHGHSPLGEMLIGSVAHTVLVRSRVPVLLVPINTH
ncbi:universal stress protein [Azospirillum thermophilum]|uniref:Universal stress protein n=1 Tax=Azospirillum thermophilum TaxID=2202148 RepID=A0A2S2CUL3_9PROT|nr:universal stress protein [Azospirillum thermophilum]AWK88159.1 universal stress protein [Azospirillum thermophilum]